MHVMRWLVAALAIMVAVQASAHSLNSRKKTGPSKTKLDLSSERQELLQTHYVFGFAPDQAKTQNALKAIAKSTKTAGKAKKGATKKGQKSKARKESLRRDAPTNGSPSIGAFKCGATAALTMCNSASGTSEVCILSEKDGKCEPQYITALPNGNPSGSRFITIEDIKEVLDIAVIPASFETVNFDDLDRGVKLVDQTVPVGTREFKLTKARLQGYPTNAFNKLHLPPTLELVDFSDNEMNEFNPSEWATVNLTTMLLRNNRLEFLDNVTFPPTLQTLNLADNRLKRFSRGTQFPAALKTLDLRMNKIGSFASLPLGAAKTLDTLYLMENNFTDVLTRADVETLPSSLHVLNLNQNFIRSLESSIVWPAELDTLDLSNNGLTTLNNFPLLPSKLSKLFLNDNPLGSYVVSSDTYNQLNAVNAVTLPSMTDTTTCPDGTRKTSTSHKTNPVYVCVQDNSSATSMLPLVLGLVGGAVCIAAFAYYGYRRLKDKIRASTRSQSPPPLTDDISYSSNRPKYSASGMGAYNARLRHSTASHTLSSRSFDSSSIGTPEFPKLLVQNPSFQAFAIPCDSVADLSPYVGDTSIGTLGEQWVVVKPLFSDHEVDTLTMYATLVHPKIVVFIGVTWDLSGTLSIVTAFCRRGSVRSVLLNGAKPLVQERVDRKLSLATDVAEALTYLHFLRQPFVHLNLSLDTIFINEDWTAALRLPAVDRGHAGGQRPWVAPEIVRMESPPTTKADMYSFGVFLLALDKELDPSDGTVDGKMEIVFADEKLGALGAQCLDTDPTKRPSAMDVVYTLRNLMHDDVAIVLGE
ncbi:serine/threonine protein kinase [Aphanomyces invadans]|uniref:Serine/threonine protein kinase n=1 Tax=Aphanomyces invadans TaxID=157072 RepID=A0A024U7Y7_9STRA|nr:serine/threonine protein kinase [Aphanomyces invadans]ETW02546.1 serine/threonine protein kinase [Aphanomyces invadans]|eukprot:XP_008869151.1 serine/threonine protein kinase [Aphanomyces invadans]